MSRFTHLLLAAFATVPLGIAAPLCARAEPSELAKRDAIERADRLYDRGRKYMEEDRYPKACPLFEESLSIDPSYKTRYLLAECYRHTDRLVEAYRHYETVAREAAATGDQQVAQRAEYWLRSLRERLGLIVVLLPDDMVDLVGLSLTIDGLDVTVSARTGGSILVSLGTHQIVATAPDRDVLAQVVRVDSPMKPVRVSMSAPGSPCEVAARGQGFWTHGRIAGFTTAGLGVVVGGLGLGLYVSDRSGDLAQQTPSFVLMGAGLGLAAGSIGGFVLGSPPSGTSSAGRVSFATGVLPGKGLLAIVEGRF